MNMTCGSAESGLSTYQVSEIVKRLKTIWIDEPLVMDDALNSRINNMVFNNKLLLAENITDLTGIDAY